MSAPKIITAVWLPPQLRSDLLQLAKKDNCSLSATMRRLLSFGLRVEQNR